MTEKTYVPTSAKIEFANGTSESFTVGVNNVSGIELVNHNVISIILNDNTAKAYMGHQAVLKMSIMTIAEADALRGDIMSKVDDEALQQAPITETTETTETTPEETVQVLNDMTVDTNGDVVIEVPVDGSVKEEDGVVINTDDINGKSHDDLPTQGADDQAFNDIK